jgi:hypothetical protein
MAYPTAAQFKVVASDQWMGQQTLMSTSTTQAHPLGTLTKGYDTGTLQYGPVECIYLKGATSTVAGSVAQYDAAAGTTTLTTASTVGPVAVSLSANIANQYGWYVVVGNVPVDTASAGTGAANAWLKQSATPGQLTVSGTTAIKVDGAVCKAAQDTPTTGFTKVLVTWPANNGNT